MILGLDTLTPQTRVTVDGQGMVFPEGADQAESVMACIAQTLDHAKASYADLTGVVAMTGPGSFTGLRVGLSAAHGIAQARGIPLYGVTVLDAFSWCVPNDRDQMLLLDSRRKDIAVSTRKAGEERFSDFTEMTFEDAEALIKQDRPGLCGNGIARLSNIDSDVLLHWPATDRVVEQFKRCTPVLQTGYTTIKTDPVYLRAPEITISDKKFEHQTLYSA